MLSLEWAPQRVRLGGEACDQGSAHLRFLWGGVWLCEGAGQPVSLRRPSRRTRPAAGGRTCTHPPGPEGPAVGRFIRFLQVQLKMGS